MRTFTIPTRPYEEEKIYSKKNVTFEPGRITVLTGCNGSGKSTLIMLMKEQLEQDKDVLVLSYDDRRDGGSRLMEAFSFHDQMDKLMSMAFESEGERIMTGVANFAGTIRSRVKKRQPKELWIFLDAVGSGMSIDGIQDVKGFAKLVIEDNSGIDTYFIISTNEYEFAEGEDCINVTTFSHKIFKTYKGYRNYILRTAEKKKKRK